MLSGRLPKKENVHTEPQRSGSDRHICVKSLYRFWMFFSFGRITGCIMVEHDWTSWAAPAGGRHTWSQAGPQERFSILPCGQNTRAALLDSHYIPKVFIRSHQTPHLLPSSAPCKLALVFSAKHICCPRWLSRHNYTGILQHQQAGVVGQEARGWHFCSLRAINSSGCYAEWAQCQGDLGVSLNVLRQNVEVIYCTTVVRLAPD